MSILILCLIFFPLELVSLSQLLFQYFTKNSPYQVSSISSENFINDLDFILLTKFLFPYLIFPIVAKEFYVLIIDNFIITIRLFALLPFPPQLFKEVLFSAFPSDVVGVRGVE
jgi:hypothetical protein